MQKDAKMTGEVDTKTQQNVKNDPKRCKKRPKMMQK